MSESTEIDLDIADLERIEDATSPEIQVPPVPPDDPAAEEVVEIYWRRE
jgi:hypothetical protein